MRHNFFLIACFLWLLAEVLNVYFIMPMPGSQESSFLGFSWFLCHYRWGWRALFALMLLLGLRHAFGRRARWWNIPLTILLAAVLYLCNNVMSADRMFLPVNTLSMRAAGANAVPDNAVVLGIRQGEEAAAYPIRYLAHHHQVTDTLNGRPVMVTYCSVCRTGRAYRPAVEGQWQKFRLVGMDRFNAMFEDEKTGSWWRQSNGLCVAGPLKGKRLEEIPSQQVELSSWLAANPASTIMQPDSHFTAEYDDGSYEQGKSKGSLTGTDQKPWQRKSWVVGVEEGDSSKAYAWQDLARSRMIVDHLRGKPLVLLLSADNASFVALRLSDTAGIRFAGDTLFSAGEARPMNALLQIPFGRQRLRCYQEFWHSWKTFHPKTARFRDAESG
jgi:hypothetical protein